MVYKVWKTWQFSFRGHSGMAGGGQPDWNSSTITWKSTQGRQPWQTKTAQRPPAVTLPGASGATGPPKPQDRTGQIWAEVSQRYCLHQKHIKVRQEKPAEARLALMVSGEFTS